MPTVEERPRTGGSWKVSAVLGIAAAITAPTVAASSLLAPSIVKTVAERGRAVVEKRTQSNKKDNEEMSIPDMIKAVFGDRASEALRVANCESRYDPKARNGSYVGVFQIHHRTHAWRMEKVGGKDLYDPLTNVRVAHSLMTDKGWAPWTCSPGRGSSGSGSGSNSGSSRSRRYAPAPAVDVYPTFTYNGSTRGPAPRSPRRPAVAT
jgi:hypothetical protein